MEVFKASWDSWAGDGKVCFKKEDSEIDNGLVLCFSQYEPSSNLSLCLQNEKSICFQLAPRQRSHTTKWDHHLRWRSVLHE